MYLRVNLITTSHRRDLTGIIGRGIIPFYVLQVSKLILIYSFVLVFGLLMYRISEGING